MAKNKIVWHPYPEEEPSKSGHYIVTIKDVFEYTFLSIDYWEFYDPEDVLMEGYWEKYEDDDTYPKIIAFSDLIEPYEERK